MRTRITTLILAVLTALAMMAAPAGAHPVKPPGLGGETQVAFAGGSSGAHSKGVACAENVSPAIGTLPIPCTVAKGGPGSN